MNKILQTEGIQRLKQRAAPWAADAAYFIAGLGFLALAKAKHTLMGYTTPKPRRRGADPYGQLAEYDRRVVDGWLGWLERATGRDAEAALRGKTVLELGPGADLGVGLYLLARGAGRYLAVDAHPLALSAPAAFYDRFFEYLAGVIPDAEIDGLRDTLQAAQTGTSDRLRYIVRPDFDLVAALEGTTVDLVFSQAAFEHFDNVPETVRRVSAVAAPGAWLVAEIDLQTHSRWIRDRDPNNIYRYPDALYRLFRFRGIPNRVRPREYKSILVANGWIDVTFSPLTLLADRHQQPGPGALSRRFQSSESQMHILTGMLCARRGLSAEC